MIAEAERVTRAQHLVEELKKELSPFVAEVEDGDFARSVAQGSCPLEAIQFFAEQTYHLAMNDMGNLSLYVARSRNPSEVDFFLFMTVAEKLMIDSLYLLMDALGMSRQELLESEPHLGTAFRTNYFTRLALFNLPGEIAVTILLNFPVWAAGARRVSAGLKQHYQLGKPVKGTNLIDTDVLDRFSQATKGFEDMALRIVAADLTDGAAEQRMRQLARFAVEYEAMVWRNYYVEGVRRSQPHTAGRLRKSKKARYSGHAAGGN
jgi:thiaminase